MTTPVGFIPSPLDHATPLQGQQVQPSRAAGTVAASQPPLNGPSGHPQVPSWAQAGSGASTRQANSPVMPASTPATANGAGGTSQAVYRAPQLHTNGRENGIAPTTPGRGKLAAPFKLVAPNADMKDIPATIVGALHNGKGGAVRGRPPGSGTKQKEHHDHICSTQQGASGSAPAPVNPSGTGVLQPGVQYRPGEGPVVNGHGVTAAAPQPLVLPNGQVLAQIAPLTPEQLAELAQNTQLKNQLYAQLLYRSMAQAGPGQAPMQLHHLLNLSPPLMVPGPVPQHPGSVPSPQMALPTGELVQNLLVMSGAQAQATAVAAQPGGSAQPQPSALAQPPHSPASQSQSTAAPAKPVQPVSYGAIASGKSPAKEIGERPVATTEGSAQGAALEAAELIDQSPALEAAEEGPDEEMMDAVAVGEDVALPVHETPAEANAVPSGAAYAPSAPVHDLAMAPRLSDANLPSSSSGNALAAADARAEEASDATPPSRGAPGEATKPPLIIRNWGSVGGGFVPFGAGQQKMAPKGGKVLPQGSVKAKPSAAIGAALGPNLVLPNGNVSGPRACAPVEAFELPGSVAKSIPAPSTASGGPANSDPPPPSATPPPAPQPAQAQAAARPEGPAYSSASLAPGKPASAPAAPKPKAAKSRAQLEGEERKRGPAGRTSMYKGVTKHRRSGRWEAHVWVREDGKQAYLGGYSTEEEAAEAHDVAALKCHGLKAKTNFHISRYTALLDRLDTVPMAELVMAIRRTSPGFTRGSSSFRGVTQHKSGRWEVRIGLRGSKHVYLGLHSSEVEAARVYDRALVLLTGQTAATNFPVSNYKNQMDAYDQRIVKGEELPGFQEDGEYSERAFESWLREQAILPAQDEPAPSKPVPHLKSPEAAPAPTENGETPKPEAPKQPVPRRTAPERKRKPPAALLDNDSEGSSPPALALNGSPRPGAKRKRSALVMKRPRSTQHVADGVLNLSQVGKPKQGRPGQRRKTSEPSDNDTAAILMNLAAVAGEASGRPGSAKTPSFRARGRSGRHQRDEDDVEISDDDEEAAMAWSPGRTHQEGEADKEADQDPDLAHHVFVPPSALILGEPVTADETLPGLLILKNLGATAAEIPPEPEQEPGARLGQWDLLTAWLGLCSVVGHMAHTMAILAMQYETPAR